MFRKLFDFRERRKIFMKNKYSCWWPSFRDKYGFTMYEKTLCGEIIKIIPKDSKVLDVGIGTGYPFAQTFTDEFDLYGLDISERLVIDLSQTLKRKVVVADSMEMPFKDCSFDLIYCFNSSWYFVNLITCIREMIRICKIGGGIIFDIMNANNRKIKLKILREKTIRRMQILIDYFRRKNRKFSFIDFHFQESPTNPLLLKRFFNENNISYFVAEADNYPDTGRLFFHYDNKPLDSNERLVYKIIKE